MAKQTSAGLKRKHTAGAAENHSTLLADPGTETARLLHDEIGPLLSAAGLKLQLVSMDHPEAAEQVREVTAALDQAIDLLRDLSRQLTAGEGRGIKGRSRKH